MGRLMAWLNAPIEYATIDRLNLMGPEEVLEIGFGPGIGIVRLAQRLPHGYIAGIDPSKVMVAQASRRVKRAGQTNTDLRQGSVTTLPWPDATFDGIVTVNNIMLWPYLQSDLAEVRRVLKPNGKLALGCHVWVLRKHLYMQEDAYPGTDEDVRAGLRADIERAGFSIEEATLGQGWKGPLGSCVYLLAHT